MVGVRMCVCVGVCVRVCVRVCEGALCKTLNTKNTLCSFEVGNEGDS